MTADLIALVLEVRTLTGRPLDAAGLERLENKIARLTPSEVTEQRATLKRLRDHHNSAAKPVTPNRNKL